MANDPGPDSPEIRYPCRWEYKIIGACPEEVRAAVAEVIGDAQHSLSVSNTSSGGKYVSLRLRVTVRDGEHRRSIYDDLAAHQHVKMVL